MNASAKINSLLVEFHRFGPSNGLIREGERYIRAAGWDKPVHEVTITLDTDGFLQRLGALRYVLGTSPAEVNEALHVLAEQADKMMERLPVAAPNSLLQVDLVTNAAELWAFPFEAWMDPKPVFATRGRQLVPTRRIRGEFAEHDWAWPAKPRILFAHAPATSDLSEQLIEEQATALKQALAPWTSGQALGDHQLMTVRKVDGPWDLYDARQEGAYTHVHILAHGVPLSDRRIAGLPQWGLRFGDTTSGPTGSQSVADALQPRDGLPVVVSLAACDSANETSPVAGASLAQELHRRGVPVVLAAQLPLTKRGATLLTECFYGRLLAGEDVRLALYEARVQLYETNKQAHDWLSLVAYVRLPEGYAEHLTVVGLQAELAMLEAAHHRANSPNEFEQAEQRVRDRIASLTQRYSRLDPDQRGPREECIGLLASAHKRLAELLFVHSAALPESAAREKRAASRQLLEVSCGYYRTGYRTDIHSHWSATQLLCLEAVLNGKVGDPADWHLAMRAAQLDCEGRPGEYWAYSSIAELHLLAPLVQQAENLSGAREALKTLKARAPTGNSQPVDLTRRQFARYATWWTNENGFFPNRVDLAGDAREVLSALN